MAFMVLLLLVLLVSNPSFLKPGNLMDILLSTVTVGILALGEVGVIVTKGIDLSIGAAMGIVTLVVGEAALAGWPIWLVVLGGLIVGAVAGALNGVMISLVKLPPIIVTLGTLSVYSGIMYVVTNGQWVQNLPSQLLALGSFKLWFLPGPVLILLLCLLVLAVFLRYTVTGRYIYAIGNNADAARLAGIRETRIVFLPYLIAGLLAGVAGVLYIAYNGFSTPSTGADLNLEAIAAAVIGGTNVFGGRGTALGAVLGAVLLGIITEALVFFHLPAVWNEAAEGLIILVAVISDSTLIRKVNMGRG
ncbi:ABC transporter permease [Alicyclobacillus cycloheptanicus]|uniref:Autoinducer 2 import system permease protein LsrC n=2 Tax=Alicyclobacillus cycloheptanicus TaxID=1457 RepID=A0ABT9XFL6_9BACL|nr:ribose/xylose/arabinose/galactoside ABC-type transport system permease subunit [Alicyclobacillus cycloheptanicus]WDM00218.1 ABC transporter permease [Alicyclobacillus cycloheptanicus]